MRSVDVKSGTYTDKNEKDLKFKVGDHVRMSNKKAFLQKVLFQIVLKKFLLSKKVKNTVPCTYVISDFNGEETVGTFYQKNCKSQIKKNLKWKK